MRYEPNDVVADAERAELIRQVRDFLAWLGDGRKLTQAGRIGLADARHLIGLLGTGDEMDPQVGGKVFKTKSSDELSGLMRVVEWAKAARLVRVTGGRLVPVRKHTAVADQPLELLLRLLEAYPKIGKSLFPRGHWRQSLVGDEFADISQALLTALQRSPGPVATRDLGDLADAIIESRYVLHGLSPDQRSHLRRTVEVDARIAVVHLQALGLAVISRNSDQADERGTLDWSHGTAELTSLGRHALLQLKGMPSPGEPVLTVRVTLLEVDSPAVWRRVIVPSSFTLDRVHRVIQEAMGWQDCHLHQFRIGGRDYGMPEFDEFGDLDILDERQFRIGDLVKPGDVMEYRYDFGDCWDHELAVEASGGAAAGTVYPACPDGAGACPPEDCGGTGGFADLKHVLAGPPGQERDEMRTWAGERYDPVRFDLAAADTAVACA